MSNTTKGMTKTQASLVAKMSTQGVDIKGLNSEVVGAGLALGAIAGKKAEAMVAFYHAVKAIPLEHFTAPPKGCNEAKHIAFYDDLLTLAGISISNTATRDDLFALDSKGKRLHAIKELGGSDSAKALVNNRWDAARKARNNLLIDFRAARLNGGDTNTAKRESRAGKRAFYVLSNDALDKVEGWYKAEDNASVIAAFVPAELRQDFKVALKALREVNKKIGAIVANETKPTEEK